MRQVDKIMNDEQHPLFNYYTLLRSGRRLALTVQSTNRYNAVALESIIMLCQINLSYLN